MKKNILLKLGAVLVTMLILLNSCRGGKEGYAVILWSPDDIIITGEIYPVISKSDMTKLCEIETPDKQEIELDLWRITFFKKKEDAERYKKNFADYAKLYGKAVKHAMVIREEPNQSSNTGVVYRAREGEVFKIIERTKHFETILNHEDFWYHILSETGIKGYRHGLDFRIFDINETLSTNKVRLGKLGIISKAIEQNYYNIQMSDQIRSGYIDLQLVKTSYGFFPAPNEKKIIIIKPEFSITFQYDKITDMGYSNQNKYKFEGADLQITVVSENKIYLHYSYENTEYTESYVTIPDLEEIISGEQLRRESSFLELLQKGPLSSNNYGRILIQIDKTFTWLDNRKLVPDMLSADSGKAGIIEMFPFISKELAKDYNGAVTFRFNTSDVITFIYEYTETGIRFIYIPNHTIDENFIRTEPEIKRIIFFNYQDIM